MLGHKGVNSLSGPARTEAVGSGPGAVQASGDTSQRGRVDSLAILFPASRASAQARMLTETPEPGAIPVQLEAWPPVVGDLALQREPSRRKGAVGGPIRFEPLAAHEIVDRLRHKTIEPGGCLVATPAVERIGAECAVPYPTEVVGAEVRGSDECARRVLPGGQRFQAAVDEPPGCGGATVGHAVRYLRAVPLSPVFGGRGNDSGGTNAAAPTADAALGGLPPVTRAPNTLGGERAPGRGRPGLGA